jgi:hypothetical protein
MYCGQLLYGDAGHSKDCEKIKKFLNDMSGGKLEEEEK